MLDIDEFPDDSNYETIAGFLMYKLRRIPKRTDSVKFSGFKFEVVDIDNYKIDQLLVTRIPDAPVVPRPSAAESGKRVSLTWHTTNSTRNRKTNPSSSDRYCNYASCACSNDTC